MEEAQCRRSMFWIGNEVPEKGSTLYKTNRSSLPSLGGLTENSQGSNNLGPNQKVASRITACLTFRGRVHGGSRWELSPTEDFFLLDCRLIWGAVLALGDLKNLNRSELGDVSFSKPKNSQRQTKRM